MCELKGSWRVHHQTRNDDCVSAGLYWAYCEDMEEKWGLEVTGVTEGQNRGAGA